MSQNGVIPFNLIGDHIYCPLFATIQNPFCLITFLKFHILCSFFLTYKADSTISFIRKSNALSFECLSRAVRRGLCPTRTLLWSPLDLQRKLGSFRDRSERRIQSALGDHTPARVREEHVTQPAQNEELQRQLDPGGSYQPAVAT